MVSQRETDIKYMPCAIRESKKKTQKNKNKKFQTLNYWLREYNFFG